jgi:CheY-like chemotaxis protein
MREKDEKLPELLIIDYQMPGHNGVQVWEELANYIPKAVPILTVAGLCSQELQSQAKASGFKGVMSKPISANSLSVTISGLLNKVTSPARLKRKTRSDASELVAHLKGVPILLVEDNEVNQLVAASILKKAGLSVKVANNGREALDMIQREHFELVLMDIQMPEMDGLEATRLIRDMDGFDKLPIVAMTAHAMSGDKEMSLKSGMNDHVNKPIDVQELFKTLAKWLPKNKPALSA